MWSKLFLGIVTHTAGFMWLHTYTHWFCWGLCGKNNEKDEKNCMA